MREPHNKIKAAQLIRQSSKAARKQTTGCGSLFKDSATEWWTWMHKYGRGLGV